MDTNNEPGVDLETPAGLEKVREILFGANLREVDARLRDLDAEGVRSLEVLRDEVRERLDALDRRLDEHVAAIHARLDEQGSEKIDRGQLAGFLQELAQRLEQRPQGKK